MQLTTGTTEPAFSLPKPRSGTLGGFNPWGLAIGLWGGGVVIGNFAAGGPSHKAPTHWTFGRFSSPAFVASSTPNRVAALRTLSAPLEPFGNLGMFVCMFLQARTDAVEMPNLLRNWI